MNPVVREPFRICDPPTHRLSTRTSSPWRGHVRPLVAHSTAQDVTRTVGFQLGGARLPDRLPILSRDLGAVPGFRRDWIERVTPSLHPMPDVTLDHYQATHEAVRHSRGHGHPGATRHGYLQPGTAAAGPDDPGELGDRRRGAALRARGRLLGALRADPARSPATRWHRGCAASRGRPSRSR